MMKMMMIQEKLKLSSESDREKIIKLLSKGKIGLFPTDTVYGICCRMDSVDGIKKIFEIKGREKDKPLLVLSDKIDTAKKYINYDLDAEKKNIIDKHWPGALTVVFEVNKNKVNYIVRAKGDTLAVRIPDYEEITEIIEKLGVPIVAPSANPSGKFPPFELAQVDESIVKSVDFIIEGECKMKTASTIVDFTKNYPEILRQGAVNINI